MLCTANRLYGDVQFGDVLVGEAPSGEAIHGWLGGMACRRGDGSDPHAAACERGAFTLDGIYRVGLLQTQTRDSPVPATYLLLLAYSSCAYTESCILQSLFVLHTFILRVMAFGVYSCT